MSILRANCCRLLCCSVTVTDKQDLRALDDKKKMTLKHNLLALWTFTNGLSLIYNANICHVMSGQNCELLLENSDEMQSNGKQKGHCFYPFIDTHRILWKICETILCSNNSFLLVISSPASPFFFFLFNMTKKCH